MNHWLKIILVVLFLSVLFIYWGGALNDPTQPGKNHDSVSLIGIKAADYRDYLKNNPQLDLLYSKDDTCFLWVRDEEIKMVENAGIPILHYETAEEFSRHLSGTDVPVLKEGMDRTYTGDVNGAYHSYAETVELLDNLASRFPNLCRVSSIGKSIEGRDLKIIKISDNPDVEEAEQNVYYLGCHHAREWISVEVPLLFARYLLEHYNDSVDVRRIVNGLQIYILPIVNPDGLEFSIHTYRMWRKNRRYNGNFAWGVDLNRNYGYMWGIDNSGSSPNPWSDIYRGTAPFSEPETDYLRAFMMDHPPAGAISYHSYSQLILYPWGYTDDMPADEAKMKFIGDEMNKRIFDVNGTVYQVGSAVTLYFTNGDTVDWVYGTFAAPVYTIELPPVEFTDGGFFTSEQIITPVFNENLPAMIYFSNFFITYGIENENTLKQVPERPLKRIYR